MLVSKNFNFFIYNTSVLILISIYLGTIEANVLTTLKAKKNIKSAHTFYNTKCICPYYKCQWHFSPYLFSFAQFSNLSVSYSFRSCVF